MDELATIPEPENPDDKSSRRSGGKKRRSEKPQQARAPIASAEDCLAIMSRLGALLTMGLISAAHANTLRGIYSEILKYHERQQSGPSRSVVNEKDVATLLRKQPELAKLFEPLLTDEQIKTILHGGKEAGDADPAA
jgi:hypothetical protein